jgi:hypothetical protein
MLEYPSTLTAVPREHHEGDHRPQDEPAATTAMARNPPTPSPAAISASAVRGRIV